MYTRNTTKKCRLCEGTKCLLNKFTHLAAHRCASQNTKRSETKPKKNHTLLTRDTTKSQVFFSKFLLHIVGKLIKKNALFSAFSVEYIDCTAKYKLDESN